MDQSELAQCPPVELADAVRQLHGAEAAIRRTLLELVVAFDREESWRQDGASDMEGWLMAHLALSRATASQWVHVAEALDDLPAIAAAFSQGRLSWDQVVALTRFATAGNDAHWATEAPGWTPAQLQNRARLERRIAAAESSEAHRRRGVRWWWEGDGRCLRLSGRLADAEGAVVTTALERLAQSYPPDPADGTYAPFDSRAADALVELASTRLAADADADRACVVVHVNEDAAQVQDGPILSAETARRLACDARVQPVAHAPGGATVGVGRTTRQVPAWLTRLLRHRDRGCRFPGCGRTRWVHAHHIVHWADGGPTDADNLIVLCGAHHRLVHEDGWRISGSPEAEVCFVRPDGRPLPTGPPPLRQEVRARLFPPDTS